MTPEMSPLCLRLEKSGSMLSLLGFLILFEILDEAILSLLGFLTLFEVLDEAMLSLLGFLTLFDALDEGVLKTGDGDL